MTIWRLRGRFVPSHEGDFLKGKEVRIKTQKKQMDPKRGDLNSTRRRTEKKDQLL